MLLTFREQTKGQMLPENLSDQDLMEIVVERYEKELMRPIQNLLNGELARALLIQRCFTLDGQGPHQFSTHAYHPQSIDNFGASTHQMVSHPSMPVSMSSPFLEDHGSSNASDHQVTSLKQQSFGGFTSHNPTLMGSGSGAFVARYEKELIHPIQNLLNGELARALLIQIQKLKLDLESAMLELDQILEANEINFAILAALPAFFLSLLLFMLVRAWALKRSKMRPLPRELQ